MSRSYGVGSVRLIESGRYAGHWSATWELPRDEQGRRRRRRIVRPTENEARRAMKAEMGRSSTSRRAGERLDEFLPRWLDEVVRVTRRERTLVGYRQIVTNHLIPAFGEYDVAALTRRDVQRWVSKLELHPTTIDHVVSVLGAAYAYAVKWDMVAANPCKGLDVPTAPRTPVKAMTQADARTILDAFKGTSLESLVTVALWTGMRQGELLGLRWADVDLDGATVTVTSSLSRLADGESIRYVLTAPKSAKSVRTIPLAPEAVGALKAERLAQMAENRTSRFGLVFFETFDRPLDGPAVTYRFQQHLKAREMPKLRFHDLRHGCATLLIASGMPIAFVSKVLGHSSINITADIYGHLDESVAREAINRLAAAMNG